MECLAHWLSLLGAEFIHLLFALIVREGNYWNYDSWFALSNETGTILVKIRVMVILCTIRLSLVKSIIDRVLELQEDEGIPSAPIDTESDSELVQLLSSLQPRIRVFGCGGCGSNTVARLEHEGLFDDTYAVSYTHLTLPTIYPV